MRQRFTTQFKAEVALEMLRGDKTIGQIARERKVAPTQLSQWRTVVTKGAVKLFDNEQRALNQLRAEHEDEREKLYAEIGRLTSELNWLKTKVADGLTRTQRRELVDWEGSEQGIRTQAQLLGLSRSGLYYKPKPISAEELAIKHKIEELHTKFPNYGSRRIAQELGINRKAVQRHMREMGITVIYPKPKLSRRRVKAARKGPARIKKAVRPRGRAG